MLFQIFCNLQEAAGLQFVENVADPSQQQRPKTAKPASKDVQELQEMVGELEDRVHNLRQSLEQKMAELKPLREQFQVFLHRVRRDLQKNTRGAYFLRYLAPNTTLPSVAMKQRRRDWRAASLASKWK